MKPEITINEHNIAMKNLINEDDFDLSLGADKPDLLRREAYAATIFDILKEWNHNHALVTAIYGDWGEGKTSFVDLIEREVAKQPQKLQPKFIRFTPWEWASQDAISSAFFKEIGKSFRARFDIWTASLFTAMGEYYYPTRRFIGSLAAFIGVIVALLICLQLLTNVYPDTFGGVKIGITTIIGVLVFYRISKWLFDAVKAFDGLNKLPSNLLNLLKKSWRKSWES